MLEPFREVLNNTRIVLASASPRRKEILENINLKLEIIPSSVEESLDKNAFKGRPHEYALETARVKADNVFGRIGQAEKSAANLLVIGSDTVVSHNGTIFGKPSSQEHAVQTLTALSGSSHEVFTGVNIIFLAGAGTVENLSFYEKTRVEFCELNAATIQAYVDTKEPMDKAGAYGIQAIGGTLVKGIVGDYFNVMGFPVHRFCVNLVDILAKQAACDKS